MSENEGDTVPWFGVEKVDKPDTSWQGPHNGYYGSQFDWKGMPKHNNDATHSVRVNTDLLRQFASNLRYLLTPLKAAKDHMDGIKLAPGAFFDAHELIVKVAGSKSGVQPTTITFINDAIQAVTVASDELDKLALKYKTEEELNAATGKDLNEHIQSARTYIANAIGGAPAGAA